MQEENYYRSFTGGRALSIHSLKITCGGFNFCTDSNVIPIFVIFGSWDLTEWWSESKPIMPDWSPFPSIGFNSCHQLIAKTSYGGHSRVKPQHWSAWWMSDLNQSSRGLTSFEFMRGGGPSVPRNDVDTTLPVCGRFHAPSHHCLKPVICCLGALCQICRRLRIQHLQT